MKRFLCPSHAHKLKSKPVSLSTEKCSICRWENRPWTFGDFAVEMENIAYTFRLCQDDPYYDPHGISYGKEMTDLIKNWIKGIHPDYRKNLLKDINDNCN